MNDLTVLSSTPIVEFNTFSHILMIAGIILIVLAIVLFFMKILKTGCVILLCIGIFSLIIPQSELPIFVEEIGKIYQYITPNGEVIIDIIDDVGEINELKNILKSNGIDIENIDIESLDLKNINIDDLNRVLEELKINNITNNKIE